MKKKINKTPGYIKLLGWLIALFAFAIGFWHTHLGLKEFKPLSWEYGSLIVAAIVLMVIVVSYQRAVSGVKIAVAFWLICSSILFIFNLNSFYPSYLGRKLIKEEAISINDSLEVYKNNIDKIVGLTGKEYVQKLQNLNDKKISLLREIENRGGFGSYATEELRQFNLEAGSNISPERNVGKTEKERKELVNHFKKEMDKAIAAYVIKSLGGKEKEAKKLLETSQNFNANYSYYKQGLEEIISDNNDIKIDSVKHNPQIKLMISVVNELDRTARIFNTTRNNENFKLFNKAGENSHPRSQFIGSFEHTINSVLERIGKKDTIGVLLLCFFIDFLVPLAMFFLIREKKVDNDKVTYDTSVSWWGKLLGKDNRKF